MKQIRKLILVKSTPDVEVGHVYEHLYARSLTDFLRSKKLFDYTDYYIDAKTFHRGFVRIEVTFYTNNALKFGKTIPTLTTDFSEKRVVTAIDQIMAERYENFVIKDMDGLMAKMKEYDAQPWHELQRAGVTVTPDVMEKSIIQQIDRSDRQFLISYLSIRLDSKKLSLPRSISHPLFMVIGQTFISNLQQIIADGCSYYSYDDFFKVKKDETITMTNLFRADKRRVTHLTNEKELAKTFIVEIIRNGLVDRLYSFLHNATYSNLSLAPDDGNIHASTGIAVGAKGWKEIGTKQNIELIINNLEFDFKLGTSRDTLLMNEIAL